MAAATDATSDVSVLRAQDCIGLDRKAELGCRVKLEFESGEIVEIVLSRFRAPMAEPRQVSVKSTFGSALLGARVGSRRSWWGGKSQRTAIVLAITRPDEGGEA
jgi:transcription elongation GreA/GreB family factor